MCLVPRGSSVLEQSYAIVRKKIVKGDKVHASFQVWRNANPIQTVMAVHAWPLTPVLPTALRATLHAVTATNASFKHQSASQMRSVRMGRV